MTLTLQDNIQRLTSILARNPDLKEVGAPDCMDVMAFAGVKPTRVSAAGVSFYGRDAVQAGLDKARADIQSAGLAAPDPASTPAPMTLGVTDDGADDPANRDPFDEPATDGPAAEHSGPTGGESVTDDADPDDDNLTLVDLGITPQAAKALDQNGITSEQALRTFVNGGGKLTDLDGIGEVTANAIAAALAA